MSSLLFWLIKTWATTSLQTFYIDIFWRICSAVQKENGNNLQISWIYWLVQNIWQNEKPKPMIINCQLLLIYGSIREIKLHSIVLWLMKSCQTFSFNSCSDSPNPSRRILLTFENVCHFSTNVKHDPLPTVSCFTKLRWLDKRVSLLITS